MQKDWEALTSIDKSGRSLSGRIMQPAFMEYGNKTLDYNNAKDKHSDGTKGLNQDGTQYLLNAIFGEGKYETVNKKYKWFLQQSLMKDVFDHLKGGPVCCALTWQDAAHEILVVGRDSKNMYFMNPQGTLQSMPKEEFEKRLFSATWSTASIPEGEHKDLMAKLPPPANNKSNYKEISAEHYMKSEEIVDKLNIKPSELKELLMDKTNTKKTNSPLSSYTINNVADALKVGSLNEILLTKIKGLNNNCDVESYLNLAASLQKIIQEGVISEKEAINIFKNINSANRDNIASSLGSIADAVERKVLDKTESKKIITSPTFLSNHQNFGKIVMAEISMMDLVTNGVINQSQADDILKNLYKNIKPADIDKLTKTIEQVSGDLLKSANNLLKDGIIDGKEFQTYIQTLIFAKDAEGVEQINKMCNKVNELLSKGVIKPEDVKMFDNTGKLSDEFVKFINKF